MKCGSKTATARRRSSSKGVDMSSDQLTPADEMTVAETLPQADASTLVDRDVLEAQVKDMYRQVAREQEADLHFEVGRPLAEHIGYPSDLLDSIPAEALA